MSRILLFTPSETQNGSLIRRKAIYFSGLSPLSKIDSLARIKGQPIDQQLARVFSPVTTEENVKTANPFLLYFNGMHAVFVISTLGVCVGGANKVVSCSCLNSVCLSVCLSV